MCSLSPSAFLPLSPLSPAPVCLPFPAALYAKFVCFLCKFSANNKKNNRSSSTKNSTLGEFLLSALSVLEVPQMDASRTPI